ncbi:MAG TPA: hypothetical protein PKN70_15325 [Smithellaceae bacterium]|jgi:hypothetical protein|nr:hypothetical protein [Smithellaceae bacterium]HQP26001.1 hypothetical protein [Smithellaceae bacterium]
MFQIQFEKFEELTRKKFAVLWPSTQSTPPTEANIPTIFTEIYAEDYYCFTEVPLKMGGRIDMVLIEKRLGEEIVLCEFKSSKKNSIVEIRRDIDRLDGLTIENLSYYSKGASFSELRKVIFQWSENETEIDENIKILHSEYLRSFQKGIIEFEDATLFCLFASWP